MVACLADIHGKLDFIDFNWISPADFLLIAGDLTKFGDPDQIQACVNWALQFPSRHRIIVAGNHDMTLDQKGFRYFPKKPKWRNLREIRKILDAPGIRYLEHQPITIEGINFFCSPYSMFFENMAFPVFPEETDHFWDDVPYNTDVFITHGPPYGILDETLKHHKKTGDPGLLKKIKEIHPCLSIFGHIHECYGNVTVEQTLFVNCSIMNIKRDVVNPIVYVDLLPQK